MKTLCLLILCFSSATLFAAPSGKLKSYYELKLTQEKDYLGGIEIADDHIKKIKAVSNKSSEDYFILGFLYRDRLYLESLLKIRVEKKFTKKEWFSSEYFIEQYRKISTYVNRAIQESRKKNGSLSYKELSAVIANPFIKADLKETAHKYSLEILQSSDLGSREHPLTRDQYVGRIYTMMVGDYCSEGECREQVKRLARELAEYSPENKKLSEKILEEYVVNSEEVSEKPTVETPEILPSDKPSTPVVKERKKVVAKEKSVPKASVIVETVNPSEISNKYLWILFSLFIVILGLLLYKRRKM